MNEIPTLLWWEAKSRRGRAQHNGVTVHFTSTELQIPGLPAHLTQIDFLARRGHYHVSAEGRPTEASREEADSVVAFLDKIAGAARREIGLDHG